MEQRRTDINKLKSFKYLLLLTIPIFLELLLNVFVGYVDQIMISKDADAVTAITNTNTILSVFIIAFQVFSMGSVILISNFKGQKNYDAEKSVYSVAFVLSTLVGLIISVVIIIFAEYFFRWIGLDPRCMDKALVYIRIVGGGMFIQAVMTIFSAFLKSNSLMKYSTMINVVVNLINVVVNFVTIPYLGIVGVALATTLSRIVGTILMIIIFTKKTNINLLKKPLSYFRKETFKQIVSIGGPSASEALSYNASQIIILAVINGLNNTELVNLKSYTSMFAMFAYMFTSAISQAMQVVIGELLGMGKLDEAKKKVYQTLISSTISAMLIAFILFLISNSAYSVFGITDPEILRIGKMLLCIEIVLEFGRAFNIVFVRALQSSGDILFPTVMSVIFCWAVAVLGSYLLGGNNVWLNLGLVDVWLAMMLDELIRAFIFLIRYKKGKWEYKLKNLFASIELSSK
jgi:putative MATE family efflux protein